MTTLEQRQARLAKIMQIVTLDAAGAIENQAEVEALVRQRFETSRDGAQMLVVQAARRLRYARRAQTHPQPQTITIPEAAQLAEELATNGAIAKAPRESAIRRAALLGQIPTAEQDSGRRWSFQREAFEIWLLDGAAHRPGRRVQTVE